MSDYVHTSGPLFDGHAEELLAEAVKAVRRKLSDRGEQLAREAFAGQIHDDHGRFLGSITSIDSTRAFTTASGHKSYTMTVPVDPSESAVTSSVATYGPWLEGTGSRNDSTRFKGYHGFRRAGQELDRQAKELADEAMKPYVERMNR